MMEAALEQVWHWTVANWFGIVGILIGLLSTVIAYVISKKEKLPRYAIRSYTFIEGMTDKLSDLKISWHGDGNPVHNLTVARLAFWNAGKDTINKADVVKAEPLVIHAPDGARILSHTVVALADPTNRFEFSGTADKNALRVAFDHIDYKEGFLIQIVHTGNSANEPHITGKIKGARISKVKLDAVSVGGIAATIVSLILAIAVLRSNPKYENVPYVLPSTETLAADVIKSGATTHEEIDAFFAHKYREMKANWDEVLKQNETRLDEYNRQRSLRTNIALAILAATVFMTVFFTKKRSKIPKALIRIDKGIDKDIRISL